MEYLLSNKPFKGASKFGSIYYIGDVEILENDLLLTEHHIVFDKSKFEAGENFSGNYNQIRYSKTKQSLKIRNDELGMLQLYYSVINNKVFVSNNLWLIIEQLSDDEISLNKTVCASFLQYSRIPSESDTFFYNIHVLPVATELTIDLKTLKVSNNKYWDLNHSYSSKVTIDDAIDQLYDDLSDLFGFIKNKKPDTVIGFGNSGGLDSRLIPHFCSINNLKCTGFITGNTYKIKKLKSTSHSSAHKISELYDFKNTDISYKPNDYQDRLNLDVRNNPLSNCQIYKNPYDQLPDFDLLICGGNGFIVSNDSNRWKHFDNLSGVEERALFLQQYLGKFSFRQSSEKIANKIGLKTHSERYFFSLFEKYSSDIYEYFKSFVIEHDHKDNLSLIRSFHQSIYNRNSPAGGFESINRTTEFSYLYYPFSIKQTLSWPLEFFLDRTILKNLITKKIPELAEIPDQAGRSVAEISNSFSRKVKSRLTGNGLDYKNWYNSDSQIKIYFNKVLERENPLFNSLFSTSLETKNYLKLHPFIALDLLKFKRILDIVYYKEFEQLKRKDFLIK